MWWNYTWQSWVAQWMQFWLNLHRSSHSICTSKNAFFLPCTMGFKNSSYFLRINTHIVPDGHALGIFVNQPVRNVPEMHHVEIRMNTIFFHFQYWCYIIVVWDISYKIFPLLHCILTTAYMEQCHYDSKLYYGKYLLRLIANLTYDCSIQPYVGFQFHSHPVCTKINGN